MEDVNAGGFDDGKGAYTNKKNLVTIEFKKPLRSRDTKNDMQVALGSDLGIAVRLRNLAESKGVTSYAEYKLPETEDPELVIVRLLGR